MEAIYKTDHKYRLRRQYADEKQLPGFVKNKVFQAGLVNILDHVF